MAFNFEKYFRSLTLLETIETDINNAVEILLENPKYHLVSFNKSKTIYINPYAFEKDDDGYIFIDFKLDKCCDAVSGFYLNIDREKIKSLEIIIAGIKIPLDRNMILNIIGSPYANFIVRITFNTIVAKVRFNYKAYFAQKKIRRVFFLFSRFNESFKLENVHYNDFISKNKNYI